MDRGRKPFVLGLALCAALFFAADADAKRGGGRSRVRSGLAVAIDGSAAGAQARLRMEQRGARVEFRVDLEAAPEGLTPELWIADSTGAIVFVGAMELEEVDAAGAEYQFRARTKKGDALPLGVTALSELGGRAIEVRNGDGEVLASGTIPAVESAAGGTDNGGGRQRARAREAVGVVDTGTAAGAEAEVRMEQRGDRTEFRVTLEGAPEGLSPELWIEDASGTLALVAVMELEEVEAGLAEYEFRARSDKGDALPFGVASLSELSGRAIEIRNGDGEMLAQGVVPTIGDPAGGSGGDDDPGGDDHGGGGGDDDGVESEDETEDEAEDATETEDETGGDDGTDDQGTGDAGGEDETDETTEDPDGDDGTEDQGSGDA